MTKKQLVLILVALVALAVYARFFTDWFTPGSIQIASVVRPPMQAKKSRNPAANPNGPEVNAVSFALNGKFKLTEVKVVAVSDAATNKYPHALWHLITDSNSVPLKSFVYGMPIQGLRPKTPGVRPDPLEPGVGYHLTISTSDLKGEHDFKTSERPHSPQ